MRIGRCCRHLLVLGFLLDSSIAFIAGQGSSSIPERIEMQQYIVRFEPGTPPRLTIEHAGTPVFIVPVVSTLDSDTQQEKLTAIEITGSKGTDRTWSLTATAGSNLWTARRFVWRLYADHIEFQQFATGHGKLGKNYFLASGVSHRWDNGTMPGHFWDTTIYADRYFSPSPNHANQFEFNIAMPQILGFSVGREPDSERDFRPERMTGLFAPPPLFLAFRMGDSWAGLGIGTKPGEYQFPALEYTGSRYAGASFFVDYMGYKTIDGEFASPILAINFGTSPIETLAAYTKWLDRKGFSTTYSGKDVLWHHLPIFCGWAEQTVESVPFGVAPNTLATQANYEKWLATIEQRGLPVGTIVIDDKWQQAYGTFEIDQKKWPDMKGFVAAQHAKGRHVLLWVPVAETDGLPRDLCVMAQGNCVTADVGKPAYEAYLRPRIRHLVEDVGIDGFKEDWVGAPAVPGLPLTGSATGIEFVRRFQWILWSETHEVKPDAMVETQTPNALFRESSDVTRLNDIWYATRNVPDVLGIRAEIAHASGWPLVDTDNASSTTLRDWWSYMQAQPSIGIPALYFVTKTESTQESPSDEQWRELGRIWRNYIESTKREFH
jgi:Glycosyl hydrolases family 31